MAINDDDLASAITAGLNESSTPTPAAEESTEENDGDTGTELEASAEGEEAPTEGEEVPAEGEEAPAEGEEKLAEGEQTPEAKAAADAKAAAEAAAKPKAPDPVNDPLPNALKPATKERIQTLITMNKGLASRAEKAETERTELLSHITETRATPQQFGDALSYLKMVNSGDPALMEQALGVMQREVEALAKILGKPVPGVDMLSGHADLSTAVHNGQISQEHAEELAAARESRQVRTAQSTQSRQVSEQASQNNAAITEGRQALNDLGAHLQASDPQYAAKNAILVDALRPVISRAHPSQWANIFKTAYDNLRLPTAPRPAAATGTPANQPLRAKTPAGGVSKPPATMLEAITQGLSSAGGR